MVPRFILLDRDGTVNIERSYLSDPAQFDLYPGVGLALHRLRELGFGLAVVTNQSGLARGLISPDALEAIHAKMARLLADFDVQLDGVYICPHGPDDGCYCRKPLPGLIEKAAADFGFIPDQAIVIGDKPIDIELGQGVGARTLLVRTGYGAKSETLCHPTAVVDDLPAAASWVERNV